MRVNIYSQELTDEVIALQKVASTGVIYSAVQLILHSHPILHHSATDDDRSAITFWLPKSAERREAIAIAFERMAREVRSAVQEGEGIKLWDGECRQ